MRGIILAGGTGSRLKPTTNIISKHLLPVFDKPMIYYPISVLMMANIQDITILVNEPDYEQYNSLLGDGKHLGLRINYVFQPSADGLADALLCALENNRRENVCVILGDNIFYGRGVYEPIKAAAIETNGATIFVQAVKDPERFGIVELDGSTVLSIEEKPEAPKSNLAITGLYIFDHHAYEFCSNLTPSLRSELEITDLLKLYHNESRLKHVDLGRGTSWFDAGVPQSMLKAASLVALLQEKQNTLIACLEEIAFSKGWIDKELLEFSIRKHQGSEYGLYLQKII